MKHTHFYDIYNKIDQLLENELIAAVKAHGGKYIFIHTDEDGELDTEEQENAPVIAASYKYMSGYADFSVSRVEVDKDGFYSVFGCLLDGDNYEWELDSISHGHLEYIIDKIPETDSVKSVAAIHSVPILILSPEDVTCVGYSPDMTVPQFNKLKRIMEKSFEWNVDIYWDALRQACENLGIEPLNKNKEDEQHKQNT